MNYYRSRLQRWDSENYMKFNTKNIRIIECQLVFAIGYFNIVL